MGLLRRARSISVWCCILSAIVSGCNSKPAATTGDPSDWGTGTVVHKAPAQSVVQGPRVSTPQALAAGQWDSPKQMYDATCGGCHNIGVGPPILGQGLPVAYIQYVGRNGLRSMPPFRVTDYTDADLASLATWINAQPAARVAAPAAAAAAPAPAQPGQATPAPAQPAATVAGGAGPQATYTMCAGCHDNGAPLLRGRALLDGYVKVVVRHGVRRMPAFPDSRIGDKDLTSLVAWLNAQPRRVQ